MSVRKSRRLIRRETVRRHAAGKHRASREEPRTQPQRLTVASQTDTEIPEDVEVSETVDDAQAVDVDHLSASDAGVEPEPDDATPEPDDGAEAPTEDAPEITDEQHVFDLVSDSGEEGVSRKDLVEAVNKHRRDDVKLTESRVYQILSRLADDGRVEKTRQGRAQYWRSS